MRHYLYNLLTDKNKGPLAGVLKIFLFLLSLIYGVITLILKFLAQSRQFKSSCKVISVGNITWGGTGKTILVEYIAEYLKDKGHNLVVLSRGYKRKKTRYFQDKEIQALGDEPYMLM
ncbi:MAG: tetraacyldisaccharide 4'-kinase, partial [Candidatus Omnitrophica bacterium]|nr:tetraacyldisaccharide 4'-kinase [Candidatus Omnitrophota bacterium]